MVKLLCHPHLKMLPYKPLESEELLAFLTIENCFAILAFLKCEDQNPFEAVLVSQ